MENPNPEEYLATCKVIDFDHPHVQKQAHALSGHDEFPTAKNCFEFVRDQILHSSDHKRNPTTVAASDVLQFGTGYCYAKSHLLCALLRANGIPAGLCYQRLSIEGGGPPFCLHGLNAIYLRRAGWYRVDARGNRDKINAQFCPPTEQLAFEKVATGEFDLPTIYAQPLPSVVTCLQQNSTWDAVLSNLPDITAQD